MSRYSHIVVGGGALGVASAYWLAKSGARDVLVLEQFELGNDRGASEDHSRIIRHSYHSADYTALTPAAFQTWLAGGATGSPAQEGEKLFQSLACITCHRADSQGRGPGADPHLSTVR